MKIFPLKPMSALDVFNNFVKIVSKYKKLSEDIPKAKVVKGFDSEKRGYLA